MGSIGEAARRLPDSVRTALTRPELDRPAALRELLITGVHDPAVNATDEGDELPEPQLRALADAVRAHVPADAEADLAPRVRVFVTLLRLGALEPAWTLAHDNGSGTVRQRVAFSTSSGAQRTSVQLPLITVVESERVYAWLPGFRDPRWGVPDAVYDVTAEVQVRDLLEEVRVAGDQLLLAGWAHLTLLDTNADDTIAVVLDGPGGVQVTGPGRRLRRPDLVKGTGTDLTRLAWAGWSAELDVRMLASGDWRASLRVGQRGLHRSTALGVERGPLTAPRLLTAPHEVRGRVVRFTADQSGRLSLRVQPLPAVTRLLPRPVRRSARAMFGAPRR